MLVGREHRDDPLDRLGGVGAVNRGEHLVAGVRGPQGDPQGLHVAQLADEDDVGVLTQGLPKGLIERGRVHAHLDLGDQGLLVGMNVLDRVFDRDDLGPVVGVDQVDHGGERRALSAAGRAGHQRQAAPGEGDVVNHLRKVEGFDRGDVRADRPHGHAEAAERAEGAATESFARRQCMGEIQPAHRGTGDVLGQVPRHDLLQEGQHVFLGDRSRPRWHESGRPGAASAVRRPAGGCPTPCARGRISECVRNPWSHSGLRRDWPEAVYRSPRTPPCRRSLAMSHGVWPCFLAKSSGRPPSRPSSNESRGFTKALATPCHTYESTYQHVGCVTSEPDHRKASRSPTAPLTALLKDTSSLVTQLFLSDTSIRPSHRADGHVLAIRALFRTATTVISSDCLAPAA